jgi:glycogen(starch) synthase
VRIALVSRELYPYVGGGIGAIVAAAARLLSTIADVTVVTSAAHRGEHGQLSAVGDPRVLPESVRLCWVEEPEPDELGAYFSYMHAFSARVDRALRSAYPDRGPDLIEFSDYLGEGMVTVQARHTHDPWLDRTLVCVRLHTTAEICAVLDGHMPAEFDTIAVQDAERYTLRRADRLLWSGGDVLNTYRRYYGESALAPAERIPDAFLVEPGDREAAPAGRDPSDDAPLEFLYLGRLERRKGVQNLLRALTATGRADIRLTLLGQDTATGPLQTSLRSQLELMAARDERIRFIDPVPRGDVARYIGAADVIVIPSLWECWPNVAREALMHNRPVLGTPVGGLTEMVVPGRSGWLTHDTSAEAIGAAVERLADDPGSVRSLVHSGGPRARFEELTDPEALVRRYRRLAGAGRRPSLRQDSGVPLVSVVIPYFRLERYIGETVKSVLAQTHPRIEILIVNDGSLREEDEVLYNGSLGRVTLLTQPNSGLSAARNLGIAQARGRYVLPLDADDMLDPTFVERCVETLERDPEMAYVTTWVRYIDPDGTPLTGEHGGYTPYGNWSRLLERNNVGGTCTALFRRRIFELGFAYSRDLTSYEDWLLYYDLQRAGHHGAVIPERLLQYRVRPDSMIRTDGQPMTQVIFDEIRAHVLENEVQWVASRP